MSEIHNTPITNNHSVTNRPQALVAQKLDSPTVYLPKESVPTG